MRLASPSVTYDAAIVGGGLAGSILATLLGRAGRAVVVIDQHPVYPPDFRAEQVVGTQVSQLGRLGLLEDVVGGCRPVMHAVAAHCGRVIGRVDTPHYGVRYDHLVSRARASIPPQVPFITSRVLDVIAGPDRQQVILGDGNRVEARLVVIASGLQLALLRRLGFSHRRVRDAHSLTFGFDVVPAETRTFPFPLLVYGGEQAGDRIDYLTVFPMDGTIRANLFTYRNIRDPWSQAFRQAPHAMLVKAMPRLERVTGQFRVSGPVHARVIDLHTIADPVRDGVVLVGDAFQTSCPAAGTGISRLLTDVTALCGRYLPRWLETPGMAADKIAAFYADAAKRAADAAAEQAAEYRRLAATETSLGWRLHRMQVQLRRRLGGLVGGPRRFTTGVRPLGAPDDPSPIADVAEAFLPKVGPVAG